MSGIRLTMLGNGPSRIQQLKELRKPARTEVRAVDAESLVGRETKINKRREFVSRKSAFFR